MSLRGQGERQRRALALPAAEAVQPTVRAHRCFCCFAAFTRPHTSITPPSPLTTTLIVRTLNAQGRCKPCWGATGPAAVAAMGVSTSAQRAAVKRRRAQQAGTTAPAPLLQRRKHRCSDRETSSPFLRLNTSGSAPHHHCHQQQQKQQQQQQQQQQSATILETAALPPPLSTQRNQQPAVVTAPL